MVKSNVSPDTYLGMDSHAYMSCVEKHAFIESISEGTRVGAVTFEKIIGNSVT